MLRCIQRPSTPRKPLEKSILSCQIADGMNRLVRETKRYDAVAPRWGDKMRTLGYYDAYLGFLSSPGSKRPSNARVIDIGAGTAAFAEAWIAINGPPQDMALLEPSRAMLDIGRAALNRRGIDPELVQARLGEANLDPYDEVLAAHVIEHCSDPGVALQQMRDLLRPGGRLHLVASKPHWCNAIIWLQWRHRTFQEDEVRSLLADAGLELERTFAFPSGPPSRTSRGFVAHRRS